MDDVDEVFGNDVYGDAVYDVRDDVGNEAERDDGQVEMEVDVVNPDDAEVVLDEAVLDDDVYVAVIANLLDDEVVEVDEVDILGDVAVAVNLTDVIVDDVVCDDLDVIVVSELLMVHDDVEDVGVDHLGDVACWLMPVDVVDVLLVVEVVVVNDVKVVVFQAVSDDNDYDAAVVGNVAADVKGLILQDVDDGHANDACCRSALMHGK